MNKSAMKSKIVSAAVCLSLGALIFSFQNCSPVHFQNGRAVINSGKANLDGSDTRVDMIGDVVAEPTPPPKSEEHIPVTIDLPPDEPIFNADPPSLPVDDSVTDDVVSNDESQSNDQVADTSGGTDTSSQDPVSNVLPQEYDDAIQCACGSSKGANLFVNISAIELTVNGEVQSLPGLGQVDVNQLDSLVQAAIGDRPADSVHVKFGWGSFARCANKSMKPISLAASPGHSGGRNHNCSVSPLLSLSRHH